MPIYRRGGGTSGPGTTNFKGHYPTLIALQTAFPTGQDGDWGIIGTSDTIYVWDSDTTSWTQATDPTQVIDDLNSNSGSAALSANQGRVLFQDTFGGLSDGDVPVFDSSSSFAPSSIRENTTAVSMNKRVTCLPTQGIELGSIVIRNDASGVGFSRADGTQHLILSQPVQTGFAPPDFVNLGDEATIVIQSDDTENFTQNSFTFMWTASTETLVKSFTFRSHAATTAPVTFEIQLNAVDGPLEFRDTVEFAAAGDHTMALDNFILTKISRVFVITVSSTGTVPLQGRTTNTAGFTTMGSPQFIPFLSVVGQPATIQQIASENFVEDQTQDLVTGPDTSVIGNLLRWSSADGDEVEDTGISINDSGTDNTVLWTASQINTAITSASGANNYVTGGSYNDSTQVLTLNRVGLADVTISFVPYARPAFTEFAIDGQSTSVTAGTTLTGSQTFTWTLTNTSNVTGNLTISQAGSPLSTTVPATASGSQALTITDVTLNAGEQVMFTISGVDSETNAFSRNFVIRAPSPHEFFYHGLSQVSDGATVDTGTLQSTEIVSSGQTFNFSVGPGNVDDYLHLLVPSTHDLSTLVNTSTGFSVLGSFTRTNNVRTINSVQYIGYRLGPLVANYAATYTGTVA